MPQTCATQENLCAVLVHHRQPGHKQWVVRDTQTGQWRVNCSNNKQVQAMFSKRVFKWYFLCRWARVWAVSITPVGPIQMSEDLQPACVTSCQTPEMCSLRSTLRACCLCQPLLVLHLLDSMDEQMFSHWLQCCNMGKPPTKLPDVSMGADKSRSTWAASITPWQVAATEGALTGSPDCLCLFRHGDPQRWRVWCSWLRAESKGLMPSVVFSLKPEAVAVGRYSDVNQPSF